MELADRLDAAGRSTSVVSVHTLKPLDAAGIAAGLASHRQAVVLEEHGPNGGLSDQVLRLAYDAGIRTRIDRFTLKDEFVHCYGSHADALAAHGLSPERLFHAVTATGVA
jgi:transketolase